MVTLLTRFDTKDEGSAETLAAMLAELSGAVPSEPGYVVYEVFRTEEDAKTFYVKESWSSREDADAHAGRLEASGQMDRTIALLAAPLATVTLRALAHDPEPPRAG